MREIDGLVIMYAAAVGCHSLTELFTREPSYFRPRNRAGVCFAGDGQEQSMLTEQV
jgi:hypothetical protein